VAAPEAVTPSGKAGPEAAATSEGPVTSEGPARTAIRAGPPRQALPASRVPQARQPPAERKAGRTGRRMRPTAGRPTAGRTGTGRTGTAAAAGGSRPKTAARAWEPAGTAIRAGRRMPNRTVPSPTPRREQRRNAPPHVRAGRKAGGRKPEIRTPRRTDRSRPSRSAGSRRRHWPRTARPHGASRSCRPNGTASC